MPKNDSEQLKKAKKRFIEELKKLKGNKREAAKALGINLVQIRSWRHKDPDFNALYKQYVIGSEQAKIKEDQKEPFIELLEQGHSQREACEILKLSIVTLRTWKKVDNDFKEACRIARFGK
ncbi:MAG: hypothetical protein NE327_18945 [Lentisphaeraceae bacterium]|nr:hypothetical protein [Lentisphaeraceae bacterium]